VTALKKILILSDSHGLVEPLETIKYRHACDHYIHCGDSELETDHQVLNGYEIVRGNCDWNSSFPNELILNINDLRLYVTHGHLYDVKNSLMRLQYRAAEVEANIVCFGHSHIAYAEKIGQTLFLNPGSIRLPKYFSETSYIVLSLLDDTEVTIQFFNAEGMEITIFPYNETFRLEK